MADVVKPEVPPVDSITPEKAGVEAIPKAPEPAPKSDDIDNTLQSELEKGDKIVDAQKVYNVTMNIETLKDPVSSTEIRKFSLDEERTYNSLNFIRPKSK